MQNINESLRCSQCGYTLQKQPAPQKTKVIGLFPLLSKSFSFFKNNILIIATIILIISVPLNTLINFFNYYKFGLSDKEVNAIIKIIHVIGEFLYFLQVPALIFAISLLSSGEKVTISQAYKFGLYKWHKIIINRFKAGILVLLGLLAFIIPGIILAVRYAFIDIVVTLENTKISPLKVSREVGRGYWWKIFMSVVVTTLLIILIMCIISFLLLINFNTWWMVTIIDCITDVIAQIIVVVLFFLYFDLKQYTTFEIK
jgi:hypothetical protein